MTELNHVCLDSTRLILKQSTVLLLCDSQVITLSYDIVRLIPSYGIGNVKILKSLLY